MGEDTSRKSFTKRIRRGSGQTSRSPVKVHGEERGEVGKKERRRKKQEQRPNRYRDKGASDAGTLSVDVARPWVQLDP
jgi:hypothetical protein